MSTPDRSRLRRSMGEQHLRELDWQIKDTDKLITSRFRTRPRAEIIESLPGFGPILVPSSW